MKVISLTSVSRSAQWIEKQMICQITNIYFDMGHDTQTYETGSALWHAGGGILSGN